MSPQFRTLTTPTLSRPGHSEGPGQATRPRRSCGRPQRLNRRRPLGDEHAEPRDGAEAAAVARYEALLAGLARDWWRLSA